MSSKRLPDALWGPLREITRPDPSEKWQVEGLIKAGNLVILSARPKTAKSIVALNLAACVATGRPFLNRPTQQGRALFVAWERHDLTVQRAFAMGLDACEDFMIWDRHRFGVAPRVDALDWWREFITTNNIRLVVFDTLAHFLRPELDKVRNAINAYDHINGVMERIAQIDNETGCTFVFVHHDRKGEGDTDEQRVLGTTALTAAADVVLQLQPIGDDKGIKMIKATGNAIDDQQLYFVIKGDYWIKVEGRPATTKEEKATKAIEAYLRQHKEATRQELIRHLIESDEVRAGTESAAKKLFYRALDDYLAGKVERKHEGKQVIFRLREELVTSDTDIEDVTRVTYPQ
jgi:RecA-family ATPase